jgi:hypothetical protein
VRTVERALAKLARRDLAAVEDGVWMRGDADVDTVAARRGSAGTGAALAERHAQDRLEYSGYAVDDNGRVVAVFLPQPKSPTCTDRTVSGTPCRARAVHGKTVCSAHLMRQQHPCIEDFEYADEIEAQLLAEYEECYLG